MQIYPTQPNSSYLLLKNPKSNDKTLRKGYYAILEYSKKQAQNTRECIIAHAIYSSCVDFTTPILVEVQLHHLRNRASKGPKSLSYDSLIDKILEVKDVELVDIGYSTYKVTWEFVGCGMKFINEFELMILKNEETEFQKWLEDEYEQLYFDELIVREMDKSDSDDKLYDQYINNEDAGFQDGLLLDSQSDSIFDEDGMQYDQDQQSGMDDDNVNDEYLVD